MGKRNAVPKCTLGEVVAEAIFCRKQLSFVRGRDSLLPVGAVFLVDIAVSNGMTCSWA